MSSSLNKVTLIGHIGRDPEVRFSQDGAKITTLSLATTETWKDKMTGEKRDRTEWHRIVCFNERISDIIERFTSKGAKIYIEGQLQTRKWTDQNGQDRYTTEVVLSRFSGEILLLDNKNQGQNDSAASERRPAERLGSPGAHESRHSPPAQGHELSTASAAPRSFLDDDVPF